MNLMKDYFSYVEDPVPALKNFLAARSFGQACLGYFAAALAWVLFFNIGSGISCLALLVKLLILFAAEITREKLFLYLQQELPYALTVETTLFQERDDGSLRIEQTIFVQRDSQKSIILGKKGAMIKKIGEQARKELSSLLNTPVHLFLFVKVRENWADDPARYKDMGLDFNV